MQNVSIRAEISGALLQYTLDPSVYLIGCSAGVYALLAAHLSNVIIVSATLSIAEFASGKVLFEV